VPCLLKSAEPGSDLSRGGCCAGRFTICDGSAEVGADVLYAPYPTDMDAVRAIVKAVAPKPVNLVVGTMSGTLPWSELQKAGVKRVSMGVALYTRVMGDLRKAAGQLADGDFASASAGISFGEIKKLISEAPG